MGGPQDEGRCGGEGRSRGWELGARGNSREMWYMPETMKSICDCCTDYNFPRACVVQCSRHYCCSLNMVFHSLSLAKWFSLPCSYGRRGACSHGRFPSVLQWEWVSLLVVDSGELPSHSPTQVQCRPVGVHMQA